MENVLEVKNLCKSYKDFSLDNVSFALPKGYIMGFVGQNGSGKTTTIRTILNMAKLDGGDISVFGLNTKTDMNKIKQNIGVVFDDMCFAPHLNLKEIEGQLKFFYSNWDSAEYRRLTEKFKLPLKRPVGSFSKGMKMKLMIACALSHKAKLLILDEPTSGIDPVARDELLDILTDYIANGENSVFFSTHITTDLARIADYITILHNGKVFYSDTKDNLLEKFVIIKGDEKDLPNAVKEKTFGFHSYKNGFDAMLDKEHLKLLPEKIEWEKADIDEMLVYIAKEASKNA